MRHTHTKHAIRKVLPKFTTKKTLKRAYNSSVATIKKKPLRSLSVLTLGAGLISGAYMLSRWVRR